MGGALGCDRHIPESCLPHHCCSSLGGRNEAETVLSRPATQEHYCDQPVRWGGGGWGEWDPTTSTMMLTHDTHAVKHISCSCRAFKQPILCYPFFQQIFMQPQKIVSQFIVLSGHRREINIVFVKRYIFPICMEVIHCIKYTGFCVCLSDYRIERTVP